uniref:Retrovirus-related Pol polyprotein from transposon TNT 1-94-like beta-barrel domain-containing protein n=1 Tax=Tanacetum cinerariifolium TaxID=118510 RepID=A0A6L2NVA4_TANCI|nr:hypothetical protein [Tanacetum cinerariifolium]
MTLPNPQRHVVSTTVLTKSKLVPITAARPVTAAALKPHVTRPRQAKTIVTKPHSPPKSHINRSPSPKASKFPLKVIAVKAPMVTAVKDGNPQHDLKDKGVIDSGCSRHMIGNVSYFSDFEELNGEYVAFGGNPKGGKISGKGIENQLSLRVKIIRSDNGTEFNNNDLNQFYRMKAEAVNTAWYVQNRVLLTKPQNKTPYELLLQGIYAKGLRLLVKDLLLPSQVDAVG